MAGKIEFKLCDQNMLNYLKQYVHSLCQNKVHFIYFEQEIKSSLEVVLQVCGNLDDFYSNFLFNS